MKKIVIYVCAFILVSLFVLPEKGFANSLTLTSKEISFWGIQPNEEVSSAINKMTKKYTQLDFDKGEDGYYTGDPTPQMAYFLEFYTDSNKKVIGIVYDHFKAKNKGLNFVTSKGLKIGSPIQAVYKIYGSKPTESTSKDPGYNYIDLNYPIVLKETNQKGTLTIKVRYGKKEKRTAAKMYGFEYKLSGMPHVETSTSKNLSTQINDTESVNSLENVLTTAKWQVQNDFDENSGRFLAYKKVNPIGLSTGVVAVRTNKIGGYFIEVIAQNPNDTHVLDASRKLLNLFGAPVTAKQFTSIINEAKKSSTYQTVNLGKHTFNVIYSDEYLQFSETEAETHFK